jgi:hypothetical protein
MPRERSRIDEARHDQDTAALAARLLAECGHQGDGPVALQDVVNLIEDAAYHGRRFASAVMLGIRVCGVCGCSDNDACEDGCWWIAEDLCSRCGSESVEITDDGLQALAEQMEASLQS